MDMDEKVQVKKKVIKGTESTKQEAITASGRTKKLAVTGLFIAMNLVLNQVTIPIGTTMEIGFAFIPIASIGYLYGPLTAGLSGVVADILGFMLRPAGFFFPGFTLNEFIVGVLCGLLLHKKRSHYGGCDITFNRHDYHFINFNPHLVVHHVRNTICHDSADH